MTQDVLVVACGGAGCNVFSEAESVLECPVMLLNSNSSSSIRLAPEGMDGCRGDPGLAFSIAFENMDAIKEAFKGFRAVVVFTILGGGTGTGMVPIILQCAVECGCRTISVMGLPMSLETERRALAQESLAEISGLSDRMYLLDEDAVISMCPDTKAHSIFRMISHSILFTVKCIVDLLSGPFFATFFDKVYTFAYVSELSPVKAVEKAVNSSVPTVVDPIGRIVVAVSSEMGSVEFDAIYEKVAEMTGVVPDIVRRNDREDTKMVVFFSVWSRSLLLLLPGLAVPDYPGGVSEHPHDGVVLVLGGYRAPHHPPEHDARGLPPVGGIVYGVQELVEEPEHPLPLRPVGRLRPPVLVAGLEELVHHYVRRMGEVQYRVLLAGRDRYQDVAEVQLVLEEAYVLSAEHYGDLLGISPAVLCELAYGHRDAGVVAVSLGGHAAGPHDQEAVLHGVLEAGDDVGLVQDLRPVLGPAVGVVAQLAGVHEVEVPDVEVRHGPRYGAHVAFELGSYHNDAYVIHSVPSCLGVARRGRCQLLSKKAAADAPSAVAGTDTAITMHRTDVGPMSQEF